ncbi:citrate lyase beta subunit [Stereum hirsutum FP-91666 SS1]|uniref:citrate lyase beta subunit n=1 Tax=Stereum hirsutum (strain FP-91666) TaxID=721885 RepID=UPI0004449273|nr:citrate lyase beta subunit [Stereum hirsutum FP-91666 SS1]EIM85863.1 citrate lyase beta subunit [Stereum hirsutum FP-91666 SS1]
MKPIARLYAHSRLPCQLTRPPQTRSLTNQARATDAASLRRSYLYVPSSSDRTLQKSLVTPSDVIIYDLEDSVAPSEADKTSARKRLKAFLTQTPATNLPASNRIAVRLNSADTPFFQGDIADALSIPLISTFVLPKVHSVDDLYTVSRMINSTGRAGQGPINLVASIESARALWNVGHIASWASGSPGVKLTALLFAAEDYCADTSIIRTPSRQELLYTRSQIVVAAKAFGLEAIDMVCVNYKDPAYLKDECEDGRRLGFNGKQAIHPVQVETIQTTFVPTEKEILRAAKILHQMEKVHASQKGAYNGKDGKEMIDAPMLKQAEYTVRLARAAGLHIPLL